MSRYTEPGYRLAAANDPDGRRGIWYRSTEDDSTGRIVERTTSIEVCVGREGDDFYVKLVLGERLTAVQLSALQDILSTGAWMVEESGARSQDDWVGEAHPCGDRRSDSCGCECAGCRSGTHGKDCERPFGCSFTSPQSHPPSPSPPVAKTS